MIRRAPLRLTVIMRAATSGKKSETIEGTQFIRERIRQSMLVPTDRARAYAGKNDSRFPRFAQNFHHAPIAPYGEQALVLPTADKNHVLIEQE